jgi:hypothetical protein
MADLLSTSCLLTEPQVVVLRQPPPTTQPAPTPAGAPCGPNVSPFAMDPGHLSAGDKLRARAWSGVHNTTATVTLRTTLLMPDCTVTEVGQTLHPASDTEPAEALLTMPESVVRTAAFTVTSDEPLLPWIGPGLVYVRLDILRADTPDLFSRAALISAYVSSAVSPSYPTSPPQYPGEGPGHIWEYTQAPFSGQSAGDFDPGPRRIIRVLNVNYGLVTSAVAGNRYPSIFLGNQLGTIAHAIAPAALGASSSGVYLFQPQGASGGPAGARISVVLPTMPQYGQSPGVLANVSNGCQAGDVISGYEVTYEEWIDPQWEFE